MAQRPILYRGNMGDGGQPDLGSGAPTQAARPDLMGPDDMVSDDMVSDEILPNDHVAGATAPGHLAQGQFTPDHLVPDFDASDDLATAKMQFFLALRSRGVNDPRVLAAMEKVDRGLFVRGLFTARAYQDVPLPIACGQTISQPSVVGLMTQAAEISPRDVVLEVGTGSGYQAAILAHLARRVYTLDRHRRLVGAAQTLFDYLGLGNITAMTADGCFGLASAAPFDRIIVTAAAEDPPTPLLAQLKVGGIMIVPVGQSDAVQSLIKVTRSAHGFDYEELRPVRFVPLVEGLGTD